MSDSGGAAAAVPRGAPSDAIARRRDREALLLDTTRRLFDERGMQDAPVDEIARAAGINRALIYRCFPSREELHVRTVIRYLDEITAQGLQRIDAAAPAREQLRSAWTSFVEYCLAHPAFVDCATALMRRPAEHLQAELSERTWVELGAAMARSLEVTAGIIREGVAQGSFSCDDPQLTTNLLYAQTLGLLHSARVGIGVSIDPDGAPTTFPIAETQVREACVAAALAAVGGGPTTR